MKLTKAIIIPIILKDIPFFSASQRFIGETGLNQTLDRKVVMSKSIEIAKKLKSFLETIHKRKDLRFTDSEIRPPACPKMLNEAKESLPQSLLDFYTVMNGCDVLAAFINNSNLTLGLRIPPLERIGEFRYPPKDEYHFPSGLKFIPLEWIEPEYAFYYLLADGSDIPSAQIVVACPAEESDYIPVAGTMGEFIEKALESYLATGWASKYFNDEQPDEIQQIAKLLQKSPQAAQMNEPGTRVKVFRNKERGSVVKQVQTEGAHRHYGRDFMLVDFDLSGRYWVAQGETKKISGKKDVYETAISNPTKFLSEMLKSEPEESARNFFRIGSDYEPYYRSFEEVEGLYIPDHSYRYASIFSKLPFGEASSIIADLLDKWASAAIGRFKTPLAFEPNGTEFEKKENGRPFHYYSVLFTLTSCLALLYILKKKQEPDLTFPATIQKRVMQIFEKLMQSPDFPTNGSSPTPFKKTMDSFHKLFQVQRIDSSVFGFISNREKWLDELELDKPFAFRML